MGITPAYAGKSLRFLTCNQHFQDHPRLCGEKSERDFQHDLQRGSPPPMRGKAVNPCIAGNPCRITPAYAGKSRKPMQCRKPMQDHPRLCGEKWEDRRNSATDNGITPAYAGKRQIQSLPQQLSLDHPRLCGEKRTCLWLKNLPPGSPPPMRGKVVAALSLYQVPGITPAYAGKRIRHHGVIPPF